MESRNIRTVSTILARSSASLEAQRRPQTDVEPGDVRILRQQERPLLQLQAEFVAVARHVGPEPPMEPAHAPNRNELESAAHMPRIRQQIVKQAGPADPARAAVAQELPVESRIGHAIPASPIAGLHERLQGALDDVVSQAAGVFPHVEPGAQGKEAGYAAYGHTAAHGAQRGSHGVLAHEPATEKQADPQE